MLNNGWSYSLKYTKKDLKGLPYIEYAFIDYKYSLS